MYAFPFRQKLARCRVESEVHTCCSWISFWASRFQDVASSRTRFSLAQSRSSQASRWLAQLSLAQLRFVTRHSCNVLNTWIRRTRNHCRCGGRVESHSTPRILWKLYSFYWEGWEPGLFVSWVHRVTRFLRGRGVNVFCQKEACSSAFHRQLAIRDRRCLSMQANVVQPYQLF